MRLTLAMFLNKKRPHGKLYRGKHCKVRSIKMEELNALRLDYEREERNMLFLRHPYLTVEQSHGHMKELKAQLPPAVVKFSEFKALKFARKYSLADALSHLRVKDAWD